MIVRLPEAGWLVAFPSVEAYYAVPAVGEARRRSREVDYGVHWTWSATEPFPKWRLTWVENTGELIAVAQHDDTVLVLGVLPTEREVEIALPDWAERCVTPGSLDWIARRLQATDYDRWPAEQVPNEGEGVDDGDVNGDADQDPGHGVRDGADSHDVGRVPSEPDPAAEKGSGGSQGQPPDPAHTSPQAGGSGTEPTGCAGSSGSGSRTPAPAREGAEA